MAAREEVLVGEKHPSIHLSPPPPYTSHAHPLCKDGRGGGRKGLFLLAVALCLCVCAVISQASHPWMYTVQPYNATKYAGPRIEFTKFPDVVTLTSK